MTDLHTTHSNADDTNFRRALFFCKESTPSKILSILLSFLSSPLVSRSRLDRGESSSTVRSTPNSNSPQVPFSLLYDD